MRKLWAGSLAIAGCLVAVGVPAGAVSAASGGFAVTRVITGGEAMNVAVDPATNIIYVADIANQQCRVDAIDAATGQVVANIGVPTCPGDLTVDPATDTVYAVGNTPPMVAVINGATDAVTTTISLASNALPIADAVNPVTHRLYVADATTESVDVFDTTSNTRTATIPLKDAQQEPNPSVAAVAVDAATNQVYVSDAGDSQVAVIDGSANAVQDRISLPADAFPRGIAIGPGTVYVADQDAGAISVIGTATDTVSATITSVPGVLGVAVSSGTLYAVAPEGGQYRLGTTYVIDAAARDVTAQIPRGGEWIAADSGSVYLTDPYIYLPDSVTVITPSPATTMCPVIPYPYLRFTLGQAGKAQLQAASVPPASFAATGLPAGLTLSPAGLLSGTPAVTDTGGIYPVTVTAANGISPPDTESFDVYVDQSPVITSATRATFRTGEASHFDATAKGFPGPVFSESGTLPKGVSLRTYLYSFSSVGELAGVPAPGTGGRYPITLIATNGAGTPATRQFTLIVDEPLSFISPRQVTFRVGEHKSFTSVTRGYPAAWLAVSGRLPHWLTFRPGRNGTAMLSGRAPRRARGREFPVIITARNGMTPAARQYLLIRVR